MLLTVKQLLQLTKSHRPVLFSNASNVSIAFNKTKEGMSKTGKFIGYYREVSGTALTNQRGKKSKKFVMRFYYKDPKYIPQQFRKGRYLGPNTPPPMTVDSTVWLSCSCEYFLYHVEVADAMKGNSSILYSNGAKPKITNPNNIAHVCKHLISATRRGALLKK